MTAVAAALRDVLALWHSPLSLFERMAREQGDWASIRLGGKTLYLASHPELVVDLLVRQPERFSKGVPLQRTRVLLGDGLLTSAPDVHREQRRRLQPAFQRSRVEDSIEVAVRYAERAQQAWQPDQIVDVTAAMMQLSQRAIAKSVLAAEISEADARRVGAALDTLVANFGWLLVPGSTWLWHAPIPTFAKLRAARRFLVALTNRLVEERRSELASDATDVLAVLLAAAEEGNSPRSIVADQVLTLFLAGHDTTGNALAWTWHLLAEHPDLLNAWHAELDSVLGGAVPTAASVGRLQLTRRIFLESLRLFPPVPAVGRTALRSTEVADHPVSEGDIVEVCPWLLHRDARFFDAPGEFDPSRWQGDFEHSLPHGAYVPFGLGPRLCIGMHYALMLGVVTLATIGQRWHLHNVVAPPLPLLPRSITLRPLRGITMRVALREAAV